MGGNRSKNKSPSHSVTIAVVGKYLELKDAYKSLTEAITHGGIANDCMVHTKSVDAERIEREGAEKNLEDVSGILVPGGSGQGASKERLRPFASPERDGFLSLGSAWEWNVGDRICSQCLWSFPCQQHGICPRYPDPVIDLMPDQQTISDLGGTCAWAVTPVY